MASLVAALVTAVAVAAGAAPATAPADSAVTPGPVSQYSSPVAIAGAASNVTSPWDPQAVSAPGGPSMVDGYGRIVSLHGVNAVNKLGPYELTITPGTPASFTATDAARIAQLGFDVVRLGILWQGLEPGTGGVNDPATCAPGAPHDPGMFSAPVASAYLAQVAQVVDLLGRFHVHTIIDMHQDVYSQTFSGEGAPAWAVCTGSVPPVILPGRWSRNYASGALNIAVDHFFANDVVGDLQGEFDRVWGVVAATFAGNPWVVGYDPYNEPFSRLVADATTPAGTTDVATALECFYTGRADPGYTPAGDRISCPSTVPATGVVPTIEAADPTHLVFVEPDIFAEHGSTSDLGPMPYGRLVYNFHAYCGGRNPVTGDPYDPVRCAARIDNVIRSAQLARSLLASAPQPGGPAWFMSEFGATTSTATLDPVVAEAGRLGLGWTYWSWKYYDDPTGSTHEALVGPDGSLGPQAESLVRPYAEAVAGRAPTESFDAPSGTYTLAYRPDAAISAPTVVATVASSRYPLGYCTEVTGGSITSTPGAPHLLVTNDAGVGQVTVQLEPGPCKEGS